MPQRLAITILLALLISTPALAVHTPTCPPRDYVMSKLAEDFGESVVGMGVSLGGGLVEFLRSETTWTIVRTLPDMTTCFIAAGSDWQTAKPKGSEL